MSTIAIEETEPAAKVWICPACGARYAEPTVCTNQHAPTDALEYDLTAAEAAAEQTEEAAEGDPAPAEPAAPGPAPAEPAPAPAESAPAPVDGAGLQDAFAALDAAVAGLKTKLGL